jgi:hypothetical protein
VVVSLLEVVEARADRLAVIHRHADPLGPIKMPLSSLASGVPTQAVSSVCQLLRPQHAKLIPRDKRSNFQQRSLLNQ